VDSSKFILKNDKADARAQSVKPNKDNRSENYKALNKFLTKRQSGLPASDLKTSDKDVSPPVSPPVSLDSALRGSRDVSGELFKLLEKVKVIAVQAVPASKEGKHFLAEANRLMIPIVTKETGAAYWGRLRGVPVQLRDLKEAGQVLYLGKDFEEAMEARNLGYDAILYRRRGVVTTETSFSESGGSTEESLSEEEPSLPSPPLTKTDRPLDKLLKQYTQEFNAESGLTTSIKSKNLDKYYGHVLRNSIKECEERPVSHPVSRPVSLVTALRGSENVQEALLKFLENVKVIALQAEPASDEGKHFLAEANRLMIPIVTKETGAAYWGLRGVPVQLRDLKDAGQVLYLGKELEEAMEAYNLGYDAILYHSHLGFKYDNLALPPHLPSWHGETTETSLSESELPTEGVPPRVPPRPTAYSPTVPTKDTLPSDELLKQYTLEFNLEYGPEVVP
jgi:hypothetical protein